MKWLVSGLFLMVVSGGANAESDYHVVDTQAGQLVWNQNFYSDLHQQQQIIVTWKLSDSQCIPGNSAVLNHLAGLLAGSEWPKLP
jgi:triacylglycerol esterase/lipase EstA (alpha/beta hydrolase family)